MKLFMSPLCSYLLILKFEISFVTGQFFDEPTNWGWLNVHHTANLAPENENHFHEHFHRQDDVTNPLNVNPHVHSHCDKWLENYKNFEPLENVFKEEEEKEFHDRFNNDMLFKIGEVYAPPKPQEPRHEVIVDDVYEQRTEQNHLPSEIVSGFEEFVPNPNSIPVQNPPQMFDVFPMEKSHKFIGSENKTQEDDAQKIPMGNEETTLGDEIANADDVEGMAYVDENGAPMQNPPQMFDKFSMEKSHRFIGPENKAQEEDAQKILMHVMGQGNEEPTLGDEITNADDVERMAYVDENGGYSTNKNDVEIHWNATETPWFGNWTFKDVLMETNEEVQDADVSAIINSEEVEGSERILAENNTPEQSRGVIVTGNNEEVQSGNAILTVNIETVQGSDVVTGTNKETQSSDLILANSGEEIQEATLKLPLEESAEEGDYEGKFSTKNYEFQTSVTNS